MLCGAEKRRCRSNSGILVGFHSCGVLQIAECTLRLCNVDRENVRNPSRRRQVRTAAHEGITANWLVISTFPFCRLHDAGRFASLGNAKKRKRRLLSPVPEPFFR